MNKREVLFIISTAIYLIFIGIIVIFNILSQNYQNFVLFTATVLYALFIFYISKRGSIPLLLRNYTPFPLALVNPPGEKLRSKLETYIIPAVQTSIELTSVDRPEKAYDIIKRVREFLKDEIEAKNIDKIVQKIREIHIYSHIENEDERKNAEFSLASLIHWIYRYRNLAFHSPRVNADPIDSWFALRTALIYIRDRYKTQEATLYTQCPYCGTVNRIRLTERNAKWLHKITLKCSKCEKSYDVKLQPETIINHYKIINKSDKFKD